MHYFTLVTDSKSLEYILNNPKLKTPARIERWCLRLCQYDFEIKHRPGIGNPADYLSRQPLPETESSNISEDYINYLFSEALPRSVTYLEVISETKKDEILQELVKRVSGEIREPIDPFLSKCFDNVFKKLSVTKEGAVMRGNRIIFPDILKSKIINLAHDGHQGITRTKQLLRSKVWFPNIDSMVEKIIGGRKALPPDSPIVLKSYYHVIDKNSTIRNDFVKNVYILFGSKTEIPVLIHYVATLYENESEIDDFEHEFETGPHWNIKEKENASSYEHTLPSVLSQLKDKLV
ncbi:unnamed protein product [Brachionus calyciflorus]|uniref:Integrase zinc-binding domain-containing protein n=1 Tax=Brachionus calyciflorus TaxID=104777 RepID=A0A813XKH1_9BILA|nr:unnamed protein product [Brachionus calyciflorus]